MRIADYQEYLERNPEIHNAEQTAIVGSFGPGCWVGRINLYGNDRTPMWEWDGEHSVYGTAFVIPNEDDELRQMILERKDAVYNGAVDDAMHVDAIMDRIVALGGKLLVWA